jgi:hypothetical protein
VGGEKQDLVIQMDREQLLAYAKEAGIKVHYNAGVAKLREAIYAAETERA